MKMKHQQLLCLIYCTYKEEGCSYWMRTVMVSKRLWSWARCWHNLSNVLDNVSCKSCSGTCIPKANWESANDMLKGDIMTFGCSGVVSRFCSSCTPSFWIAAAMASLDCRLRPVDWQTSSCSSSDEPPSGLLLMVGPFTFASVVNTVSGCGVLSFSAF